MNLEQAYRKIWSGKLERIDPPQKQWIERVVQTAELIQKHWAHHDKESLLDCGTGSGAMLARAKGLGFEHVRGLDFDGPLLDWLVAQGYEAYPYDLNVDRLPDLHDLDMPGWQVITCCDVIEHLIDPHNLLREMAHVLRPGGHAYVSTPNCSYWKRAEQLAGGKMFRTSGDDVLKDGGHLSYWGPQDLRDAMMVAGFGKVVIHYRNPDRAPPRWNFGEWSNHAYMIAVGTK